MNLQQFERQVGALREQVASLWPLAHQQDAALPPSIADAFEVLCHALDELQAADTEIRQQCDLLARQQDVLEATRRRWHDLFDLAPDGYIVSDLNGIIVEANQAAAQLFGGPQIELVGVPLAALVARQARRGFLARLSQAESEQPQHFEIWLQRHHSSPLLADVTVARMAGIDKGQAELTWLIRDATVRQTTEESLRQARDELESRVQERTADLEASHRQAQVLGRRLLTIQETERTAIAQELHDQAGQTLTALILGLGMIQREATDPQKVVERAAELKQIADDTMEGLHRLAMRLRPISLDRVGLMAALTQHVEACRGGQDQLDISLEVAGLNNQRLPREVETTLYRLVQEALTNVVRHARARNVGVIVARESDLVRAIVEDDGSGFDVDEAMRGERLGLLGMRERVEMLGGTFAIESTPGRGTTVFAVMPCVSDDKGDGVLYQTGG